MAVKYDDREAVAHGKITTKPLRERPGAPSWALKLIMAITGIIFGLFVFVHMIGNLKIFLPDTDGVNHLNEYAAFLREFGEPMLPSGSFLWAFRIVLLSKGAHTSPVASSVVRDSWADSIASPHGRCSSPASCCCCSLFSTFWT